MLDKIAPAERPGFFLLHLRRKTGDRTVNVNFTQP
jgi:hypothetical protein